MGTENCGCYAAVRNHFSKASKPFNYPKCSRKRRTLPPTVHHLNLFLLLIFHLFVPGIGSEPPRIFPENDKGTLALVTEQSLDLHCDGDEPLSWHHDHFNLSTNPRVSINESVDWLSSRNFSTSLHIDQISLEDQGLLTCGYTGKPESENTTDIRHIIVVARGQILQKPRPKESTIHAVEGDQVIIACKPLWKDVKITLTHNDEIELNEENYSIDVGYIIPNVTQYQGGAYHCGGTYNGITQFEIFIVNVIPPKPKPSVPSIETTKGSAFYVGEEFVVLCNAEEAGFFGLNLENPADQECEELSKNDSRITCEAGKPPGSTSSYKKPWFKKMTVKEARKEDSGIYKCLLTIYHSANPAPGIKNTTITIYDYGEEFVNAYTEKQTIQVKAGDTARWIINVSTFPINFTTSLRNPKGREIKLGKEKRFNFSKLPNSSDRYKLEIFNVQFDDNGSYPMEITLPEHNVAPASIKLNLKVSAVPVVKITTAGESGSNCQINQICELTCKAIGGPLPTISWTFQECGSGSECKDSGKAVDAKEKKDGFTTTSVIRFNATQHRNYTCTGKNSLGQSKATQFMRVVDYPGSGEISIISPREIVSGDDVEIVCAVSKLRKDADITWIKYENQNELRLPADFEVTKDENEWSYKRRLIITNISRSSTGIYHCKANYIRDSLELKVIDAYPPKFIMETLNDSKATLKLGESMNLTCLADGKPDPVVTWFWEGRPEHKNEWPKDMKYEIPSGTNGSMLMLKFVPIDAQGRFKCEARNRNGVVEKFLDLTVTGSRTFSNLAVAIILLLFIAVIIFGTILARYKYKQGELNRFLREISQKDFYNGAVENINPDLSVTDQAYLLPFDTKWEFPKDRLKFGIQLGSGAFGRVVKADAVGILENDTITTVAVKMVKPNADETHFKALMSELKIMVHLGQHINVVNLLGACTKNLAKKKELFVIVEYCKYGSLLSYMHRHKRTFINQLDPAKGTIDPNIDWPTNRNSAQSQARTIHYAQLTFTDTGNSRKPASNGYKTLDEFKEPDGPPTTPTLRPIDPVTGTVGYFQCSDMSTPNNRRSTEHYVPESQVESVCTGISYLSNGPSVMTTDGTTKRASSWDHYRGDYQARDVNPIRTTDLLCWAFQIARGMDYLASRKVLHGDLAARNVLLAENNVVKICDFGLAKEMYKDYKYKKKSEGVLLPVKWMAIESIYYGLFSSQSDCWSFGVVLWELFTLGKTPYPGMDADERFYKRIMEGYRMEKPALAPSCVYDIMLECWAQEPLERPTFSALVDRIGDMMEEGLRNHYVDLNYPYMKINQTYMAGRPDYLLQMGRSDFASASARPTPERQYQNLPEELDASGYLVPLAPGVESPSSPTSSCTYQNVQSLPNEPVCTMIANNSGYSCTFIKPPEDHVHGPDNRSLVSSDKDNQNNPAITLQILYTPDIKDVYGLREDSTSPDRNSLDESQTESSLVNGHVPSGIDNVNYVPYSFQCLAKSESKSDEDVRRNNLIENNHEDSCKSATKPKRQKNDSGLGSIDSTQLDGQRYGSSESQQQQQQCSNNDLGMLQQPNGYISHKYITT